MKTALSLLVLLVTISFAHAGGLGGPPPFTNGSPLNTGVNGSYQASVRGDNLSGLITFNYTKGVQSTTLTANRWVIFFEGQVFAGNTTVNIMDGNISGILDASTTTPVAIVNSSSSTSPAGSQSVTVTSTAPGGFFTGDLDNNSTSGYFKGNGQLSSVITTVTAIVQNGITTNSTTTEQVNAPFKVKGVRVAYPTS